MLLLIIMYRIERVTFFMCVKRLLCYNYYIYYTVFSTYIRKLLNGLIFNLQQIFSPKGHQEKLKILKDLSLLFKKHINFACSIKTKFIVDLFREENQRQINA